MLQTSVSLQLLTLWVLAEASCLCCRQVPHSYQYAGHHCGRHPHCHAHCAVCHSGSGCLQAGQGGCHCCPHVCCGGDGRSDLTHVAARVDFACWMECLLLSKLLSKLQSIFAQTAAAIAFVSLVLGSLLLDWQVVDTCSCAVLSL